MLGFPRILIWTNSEKYARLQDRINLSRNTGTALPTSTEKLPVIVDVSLQFTLRQKSKSTTEGEEL